MLTPTNNYYRFKYLKSGLSGPGLEGVWLPNPEDGYDILCKEENMWTRPQLPPDWKTWKKEEQERRKSHPEFVDPRITEFEDREWRRRANGVFCWIDGELEYLTGAYYWILTHWETDFGFPDFRDDQKEYWYFTQYCDEDPDCYGDVFCTLRRGGKSMALGGWEVEYATRTPGAHCGNQGEDAVKIKKFYKQDILSPFRRLADFWKPIYNTGSTQQANIEFIRDMRKKLDEEDEPLTLNGWIDHQPNDLHKYDRDKLHRYGVEEPGKTTECNIYDRWDKVKPCLRLGRKIIGKAKFVTTVDQMEQHADVGGKAFEKLFYDSDIDKKQKDGRTKSGLYACYMPADCAFEGGFDRFGKPLRHKNRQTILLERESLKNSPKKLASLIRQFPLTLREIFYVNSDKCEFNAQILNDRREALMVMDDDEKPRRGRLEMNANGKVYFEPDENGWLHVDQMPDTFAETNRWEIFDTKAERMGTISMMVPQYRPLNNSRFIIGLDPIQHGVKKNLHGSRSKPVAFVKRKYDAAIDGTFTPEIAEQRRKERYPYKTGRYVAMMDDRPEEPNVLYERLILMCLFFGCKIHVESQRGAVIDYFKLRGMKEFIMSKFAQDGSTDPDSLGTHASNQIIQDYTSFISTYVQYFGHTIPFFELVDNLIYFDPTETEVYDYAVAMGYTEMGERHREIEFDETSVDLSELLTTFNNSGNTSVLNNRYN